MCSVSCGWRRTNRRTRTVILVDFLYYICTIMFLVSHIISVHVLVCELIFCCDAKVMFDKETTFIYKNTNNNVFYT